MLATFHSIFLFLIHVSIFFYSFSFPDDIISETETVLEVSLMLVEEQVVGTTIGHLKKEYETRFAQRDVTFSFLRPPDPPWFHLHPISGNLSTSARPDREQICKQQNYCTIKFDVAAKASHRVKILRVVVTLLDINDNPPHFTADNRVLEITESSPPGSQFDLPLAWDPDSPNFGVKFYRLKSRQGNLNDTFQLSTKTEDFSYSGWYYSNPSADTTKLVLKKPLDRELLDSYDVRLVAVDGGEPEKTGVVNIKIIITDVNDNSPIFEKEIYSKRLSEDAPLLTSVMHVRAVDYDADLNGKVVYSMHQSITPSARFFSPIPFVIDTETGEIYLNATLDYESSPSYELTVTATDQALSPTSSTTQVHISIIDINDNSPQVAIDTLCSMEGVAEVAEETEPGAFVAHLRLSDADSGDNGRAVCGLNDTFNFQLALVEIKSTITEYQIVNKRILDREQVDCYYIEVFCYDFGSDQLTSSKVLKVNVLDVNDHKPTFSHQSYSAHIREGNLVGATVIQLEAVDGDEGDNKKLEFFIIDQTPFNHSTSHHPNFTVFTSSNQLFYIESDSGLLKASVSLDRETFGGVVLRVGVMDHGDPPLKDIATIKVTIDDVNDHAPLFTLPSHTFGVRENQPAETEVGRVMATDADEGGNAKIVYSIAGFREDYIGAENAFYEKYLKEARNGTSELRSKASPFFAHHTCPFTIESHSGLITTSRPLDREKVTFYQLTIQASDMGTPSKHSLNSVTVYVADENDNSPKFETDLTFHVSPLVPVFFIVARLRASDADYGTNSKVKYYIVSEKKMKEDYDLRNDDEVKKIDDDENYIQNSASKKQNIKDKAKNTKQHQNTSAETFALDEDRGFLYTLHPLSNSSYFLLIIQAQDSGSPSLTSQASIKVVINSSVSMPGKEEILQHMFLPNMHMSGIEGAVKEQNLWLVCLLAVVSGAVVIMLVVAIVVVCRQDHRKKKPYRCRVEEVDPKQQCGFLQKNTDEENKVTEVSINSLICTDKNFAEDNVINKNDESKNKFKQKGGYYNEKKKIKNGNDKNVFNYVINKNKKNNNDDVCIVKVTMSVDVSKDVPAIITSRDMHNLSHQMNSSYDTSRSHSSFRPPLYNNNFNNFNNNYSNNSLNNYDNLMRHHLAQHNTSTLYNPQSQQNFQLFNSRFKQHQSFSNNHSTQHNTPKPKNHHFHSPSQM